jgi:hypothetical protein
VRSSAPSELRAHSTNATAANRWYGVDEADLKVAQAKALDDLRQPKLNAEAANDGAEVDRRRDKHAAV